jgi:hypothetical protein
MEVGTKSRIGDDRMPGECVPEGLHTRCLLYHLVWSQRRILSQRCLRSTTCHPLLRSSEVYGSASDVTSIPGRNIIIRVRGYIFFQRFLVACFFVDNLDVFASEAYRPVVVWIGGETMARDILFFSSGKSIVTSLNRHT